MQGSDAVTVVWRNGAGSGRVCYGTRIDTLDFSVDAADRSLHGETQHEARITGLEPDTLYYYAAVNATCPSAAPTGYRFRTSPLDGSERAFRVWIVGDSGTASRAQANVRDAMLAETRGRSPELFLHLGDMAYGSGTDDEFGRKFFDIYAEIMRNTVVWPAIGNHEARTSSSGSTSGPYYEGYVLPGAGEAGGLPSGTEAYYSFNYANVHFVALDSADSNTSPSGSMLQWLEEDLSANDLEWTVAFWHHPPYTKGSHDSDTESRLRQMRENALPILEAHGVQLILNGHSHIYERSYLVQGAFDTPTTAAGFIRDSGDGRVEGTGPYDMNDGTVYVVAGHGGTGTSGPGDHPLMFFDDLDNGSVLLDIAGGRIQLTNVTANGEVSDHATLVNGEGLYLVNPVGGERVFSGSPLSIRWSAVGTTLTTIDIDFSIDGGTTWYAIARATEDDGIFEWMTPALAADNVRVRIEDTARPILTDTSSAFSITNVDDRVLVPFGDVWEYSDGPAAPSDDWRMTSGTWPTGEAQLGYGDGDESTVLMDADPNIASAYFRQEILLDGGVDNAELEVVFDDGIAVWINDELVAQQNIGSLAHDAYSDGSSSDDEHYRMTLDPGVFRVGSNIIAAVVKQSSASSSDLTFDLRLTGRVSRVLPADAGLPSDGGFMDAGGSDSDSGAGSAGDSSALDGAANLGDVGMGDEGDSSPGSGRPPGAGPDAETTLHGTCGCRLSGRLDGPPVWSVAWLFMLVWRRARPF